MDRAVFVCGKFVDLAKTYGATNIIAVGTSAIREAKAIRLSSKTIQRNRP